MAHVAVPLTATPTQVTGLSAGTLYLAQNGANYIRVSRVASGTTPTSASPSFGYRSAAFFSLEPKAGEEIWAWAPHGDGVFVYDSVGE